MTLLPYTLIADFGLAKQKQREHSVMKSVVGTVPYWWYVLSVCLLPCQLPPYSPELVQGEPYNEKADVWAAGCILYQMATLRLPFQSTNLLALAKKVLTLCQLVFQDLVVFVCR